MSAQDTPRFPPQGAHDGLPPSQMPVRTASAPPVDHTLDPNRPIYLPYRAGGQGYVPSQPYAAPPPTAGVFVPGQPFVPKSNAHAQPPPERVHSNHVGHMGNVPPPMTSSPGQLGGRGMPRGMPRGMNPNNVRPFVPQQQQHPATIPGYIPRVQQPYYQQGGYNMQHMPGQPMYPPMNQYGSPAMQPPHVPMNMPGAGPMHVMPGQQMPPPVQRPVPVVRERKALVIIDPKTNKPINECKALATDPPVEKPRSHSDAPRPTSTLRANVPAFVYTPPTATTAPLPPPPAAPAAPASPVKKVKSPPPTPIAVPLSPKKVSAPASPMMPVPSSPAKAPSTPKKTVAPAPVTPKVATPKKEVAPVTPKVATPKTVAPVTPKAASPKAAPKVATPKASPVVAPKAVTPKPATPKKVATPVSSPKKKPAVAAEPSIMFGTVEVSTDDVVVSPKAVSRPPGFTSADGEKDNEDDNVVEEVSKNVPRTEPRPANTAPQTNGKRCYSVTFLLSFREEYADLPAAAKDPSSGWMSMEVSNDGPNTRARRQNSGGRGIERQNSRGDKGGKWSRDQAPPRGGRGGRGGGRGGRGGSGAPSMMETIDSVQLKRSDDRWVPKKATNNMELVSKQVQSIMNKMTNQKFERLAGQLSEINMDSSDMVEAVIKIIFDKALGEPHFCDMYANLCVYLETKWKVWSYLQIVQNDDEKKWYWTTMSDNDAEVVGPFESLDNLFESATEDPQDVVSAPEGLALKQVRVRNGKFVKVWAVADDALYWSGQNVEDLGATQVLHGPFDSFELANVHAIKTTSFKRILLNSCQEEFEKDNIYEELDAGIEKARAEGTLTAEYEAEYEEKKMLTKRRMLGNIRFIGELYKKGMLQERIMHECVAKMLNVARAAPAAGENVPFRLVPLHPTSPPDEESIESLSKLLTTMGKNLEMSSGPHVMAVYFEYLGKLTKDKRLSSRIIFMLMDVIDLRNNKWTPRRKELTQKTLDEIRKDVEKEAANKGAQATRGSGRGPPMSASSRDRDRDDRGRDDRGRGGSFRGNQAPPQRSNSTSNFASDRSRSQNFDRPSQGRPATFGSAKGRPAKPAPPQKKKAPSIKAQLEALDDDTTSLLSKKARGILDEFVGLQDPAEALACLQELKTSQSAVPSALVSAAFVKEALVVAMEEKAAIRDAFYDCVTALCEKKALEVEAVQFGLETALLLAPDLKCDVPKIGEHLATIVVRLMALAQSTLTLQWLTMGLLFKEDAEADILEELVEGGVLSDVVGLVLARMPPAVAAQQASQTFQYLNLTSILPSHARTANDVAAWLTAHSLTTTLAVFTKALELLRLSLDLPTDAVIARIETTIPPEMRSDALFAKQVCLFMAGVSTKPSAHHCQLIMGLCGGIDGQAALIGGLAQSTAPADIKHLLKYLVDHQALATNAIKAWSDSAAQRLCVKGAALEQMDEIVSRMRK